MKTVLTTLIYFSFMTVFGQKIELFGGQNKNTFYNSGQTYGHFYSSYNSGSGFVACIGVDSVKHPVLSIENGSAIYSIVSFSQEKCSQTADGFIS